MHVRCPHCHNPIELVEDAPFSEISCPSCGSSFSLVSGETTKTYVAANEKIVGHFELIEQLGAGHFGTVWKARDTELDRTVAIKIPRSNQLSPEESGLFFREARAAAQLRHPNIVSVHEVGRHDGTIYIVSDLVQGADLKDWLSGRRPTIRESAELCVKIAKALHHAHKKGVVHRDLKPSNIMIDADVEPHIMDFGLAKRDAGEITMTVDGQILGTPAYMSPEQARGEGHQSDARSDVYSLGVILFELLTGQRPFRGGKRMLIHQVIHEDAPGLRKLNQAVSKDLETICLKCLEKEPERRYSTAQELSEEIERYLNGEPIKANPASLTFLIWKWCKRNPTVASLASLVVLLLTLLVINSGKSPDTSGEVAPVPKRAANVPTNKEKRADEVQRIELLGAPTGGSFTITWNPGGGDETTAAIAWDASAATVQAALEGLATSGPGDFLVTGSNPWFVQFTETYAATDVNLMSVNGGSLTGTGGVEITTLAQGGGVSSKIQAIDTSNATAGTYVLAFNGTTTLPIAFDAAPSAIQTALELLPSIGAGNVSVFGAVASGLGGYYYVVFTGVLAGQDNSLMVIAASRLGAVAQVTNPIDGGVASADEFQFVDLGGATGGTFTLTFDGETTSPIPYDSQGGVVQAAITALPSVNSTDISVDSRSQPFLRGETPRGHFVRFRGGLASTNVSTLILGSAGLTGIPGSTKVTSRLATH